MHGKQKGDAFLLPDVADGDRLDTILRRRAAMKRALGQPL
jgi:hypothetical protein